MLAGSRWLRLRPALSRAKPMRKRSSILGVDHPVGRHPAPAGDGKAPAGRRGDFAGRMGVRIDAELAAEFDPAPQPAPVKVEAPWAEVRFLGFGRNNGA